MTGRRAMSHLPAQVAGSVIYAEGLTRDFGSVTALKLAPVAAGELGERLVVAPSGKGHQVGCHVAALSSPLALLPRVSPVPTPEAARSWAVRSARILLRSVST